METKNIYYYELVNAIRDRLPRGTNLANYLMDVLCLGKESVYRRLRGEVPFTFEEVVILTRKFNISIDSVIGDNFADGALFNLQLLKGDDEIDYYRKMLNYYKTIFSYVSKDPDSTLCSASNILSLLLYMEYEALTRYRLCRCLYHNEKLETPSSLMSVELPDDLLCLQSELIKEYKQIGSTTFIWDDCIISSMVKEINYFSQLRVISKDDVQLLKRELMALIDNMEEISIKGCSETGKPVAIYLSNINFDATYTLVERKGFQMSFFRVYSINSFDSQNKVICDIQKEWIRSLRRHSTLISQSGEIERLKFFALQRSIIQNLGN